MPEEKAIITLELTQLQLDQLTSGLALRAKELYKIKPLLSPEICDERIEAIHDIKAQILDSLH